MGVIKSLDCTDPASSKVDFPVESVRRYQIVPRRCDPVQMKRLWDRLTVGSIEGFRNFYFPIRCLRISRRSVDRLVGLLIRCSSCSVSDCFYTVCHSVCYLMRCTVFA